MRIERLSQPTEEPVSLEELKAHCRVTWDDDDDYLTGLGVAARSMLESELSRSFIDSEWAVHYDYLPATPLWVGWIELPIARVSAITGFYFYRSGVEQEYTTYQFSQGCPGRVAPPWGSFFPLTFGELDSVKITFTAGYGEAAVDVPEVLKHAIKLLVQGWYENREEVTFGQGYALPIGVKRLIKSESWRGW